MLIFAPRTQIAFTLMWAWNRSLKSSRQSLEQGLSLANLILTFTAALVRALEVDIRRLGLLCSGLHAWLKRPLLRVLMPATGVALDLRIEIEGSKSGWHLLSSTGSSRGWLEKLPAPALQLDGWCMSHRAPDVHSPGRSADLLHFTLIHQARSLREVVTYWATSSG